MTTKNENTIIDEFDNGNKEETQEVNYVINQNEFEVGGSIGGSNTITPVFKEVKPKPWMLDTNFYTKSAVELMKTKNRGESGQGFVVGLSYFDTKLTKIIKAVKADDPFADQLLLDMEQAISDFGTEIKSQQTSVRQQIHATFSHYETKMSFHRDSHCVVVRVPTLYNSLSNKALFLLKEIDSLYYWLHIASRSSIIAEATIRTYMSEARKRFRNIISSTNNFVPTSITRIDLAQENARVLDAYKKNGKITLTNQVLLLEKRALCSPLIYAHKSNRIENEELKIQLEKHDTNEFSLRAKSLESDKNKKQIISYKKSHKTSK